MSSTTFAEQIGAAVPTTAGGLEDVPREPHALATELADRLIANIETVVRGRHRAVEAAVVGLLSGGHVLLQDLPGSGKTTLATAIARSIGGSCHRIQGTADLMPDDITGSTLWLPSHDDFAFRPGPVFANVVLVDELNRATPRAQSALLEAMDEGAVTVDGVSHPLPDPFFVVATQNPGDQHGTFPLPEGQLDRFALALTLGPNDLETELRVMREQLQRPTVNEVRPVLTVDDVRWLQREVRRTFIADAVIEFALRIVAGTRSHRRVRVGASSRAALSLLHCCQARALLAGRDFVTPDDVKALAPFALGHRLALNTDFSMTPTAQALQDGTAVIHDVMGAVAVPLRG